ncbi:MAG: glycosyltransferase family 39 protein [Candidatus Krumholzibacteriota bacterium]|nr:glycosyltransferase family 39 protein [Candidatus Krumholzibacteriota bacterium]
MMDVGSRNKGQYDWWRRHGALALIFLVALGLRLYLSLITGTGHNGFFDMARYNNIALGPELSFAPPPGYPLFLKITYLLFGRLNFRAVYLLQSIISALTVLIFYRVTVRAGGRRTALLAAAAAALYPNFIVFNLITLTETIGIFFVLLLFLVLTDEQSENKRSILSALILCAGYLIRPALIFFWPGTLLCLKKKKWFVVVTIIIIGAWVSYGSITGKGSRRFARGFYKTYNPSQRGSKALELRDTMLGREDLPSSAYLRSALDFIVHNRWETVDIIYYKLKVLVSRGYSNYTVSQMVKENRTLSQILYYGYLPVMIFGFCGLVRLFDKRTRALAIPLISYLFFNILLSIFKARYRLMIEPGLIIFGSLFIGERLDKIRSSMIPPRSGIAGA